jgi:hypothetical protein
MARIRWCAAVWLLLVVTAAFPQQNMLQDKILAKEHPGLDCLKSGKREEFAALTAQDAVFVDAHGPASKAEAVKNTSEFRLDDYTIKSGLISNKLTGSGTSHGKQFKAKVYVSSVWAEHKGKWVCLFSQETAA